MFLASVTIGGPEEAYGEGGYSNFTINELLKSLQQTANLSGMQYNTPTISHNMIYIENVYNKREEVEQRAREHAERLCKHIVQKYGGEIFSVPASIVNNAGIQTCSCTVRSDQD